MSLSYVTLKSKVFKVKGYLSLTIYLLSNLRSTPRYQLLVR